MKRSSTYLAIATIALIAALSAPVAASDASSARGEVRLEGTINGEPGGKVRLVIERDKKGNRRVLFSLGRIDITCDNDQTVAFSWVSQRARLSKSGRFELARESFDARPPNEVSFLWVRGRVTNQRRADGRLSMFVDLGERSDGSQLGTCTTSVSWSAARVR